VSPHPPRWFLPLLLPLLALIIVSSGFAAGCGAGGGGSGGDDVKIAGDQFRLSGTQRDAQFAVGSESFTEQEVLGNIAIEVLEAADATVIDRTGLGGNEEVRQALESGEIDLYWEYTATGKAGRVQAVPATPENLRSRLGEVRH
jgi:osmoprotectant transport system substrate-binding protein